MRKITLIFALLMLVALPAAAQEAVPADDFDAARTQPNLDALQGVDGFADSCREGINYAGFTVQFAEAGTITVRSQAYTDFLDETVTITDAAAGESVGFTINGPELPENTTVQFTISNGVDGSEIYVAVNCTTGEVFLERLLNFDGRILGGNDLSVVVFPKIDHDGNTYLDLYTATDIGNGRQTLEITAEELAELPENPETNIVVGTTSDGLATLYKLTSGEWQLNFVPDFEGVHRVLIFDSLSPSDVRRADYR